MVTKKAFLYGDKGMKKVDTRSFVMLGIEEI